MTMQSETTAAEGKGDRAEAYGFKEVISVFKTKDGFEAAIGALELSGINRARISVLDAGSDETNERLEQLGFTSVKDIVDKPGAPRTSIFEPESISVIRSAAIAGFIYVGAGLGAAMAASASGGLLLPAIIGAVGSGAVGGALGGVLSKCVAPDQLRYVEESLQRGGLVVWVGVYSSEQEAIAVQLFESHGGTDTHVNTP